ncbi:hypothetical protein A3K02_02795 [candidate division WS6 bacterium RIFOXYD1_FULL_33_8]|uniref:Uncharacterized protein n=1 Tax=candidate division WS6 bacterium RIFOXYB1_FULL_33_14 TaxID=1817896 RepID=A0A1F4UHR9_9BACT|nr:MAG: hypothetical protein A3K02_02795 [candidate division WS6 bacterium RIFOXYD1_FULL_33_8]OGC44467.1 MAG: hypothetical protein A2400_00875 [candidate division WS6 bacterium RIFOXYB1_FULL_33_14]
MERRINIKNKSRVVESSNGLELSGISNYWLFKIFAIGISSILLFSVYNSVKLTIQKLEILKQAEQEVEDLRVTNLALSIGIKEMSTDKYLEKEARDRLNFGGKNEVVFVIPQSALDTAKERVEEIVQPPKENIYEKGNSIDDWVDFLVLGI